MTVGSVRVGADPSPAAAASVAAASVAAGTGAAGTAAAAGPGVDYLRDSGKSRTRPHRESFFECITNSCSVYCGQRTNFSASDELIFAIYFNKLVDAPMWYNFTLYKVTNSKLKIIEFLYYSNMCIT